MRNCAGKGLDVCATCINAEHDPFECARCKEGDRWEAIDDSQELTIHDLKLIRFEEET